MVVSDQSKFAKYMLDDIIGSNINGIDKLEQ